jgi:hypothetical protein
MKDLMVWFLIGGVVVIALIIAYIVHLLEKKRTKAMAEAASELAFDFSPLGDPTYFDSLKALNLFSQGRYPAWTNMMRGEAGGLAVMIFDYAFTVGSGKHKRTVKQTVICFQFDSPSLPLFSLRPESFWHKVGGWLGMKDINFDLNPKFSSAYYLQGPDEEAIRKVFTPAVLAFFEETPNLSVEAMGDRLLYYIPAVRHDPKKIRDLLTRGFEILKQFRP